MIHATKRSYSHFFAIHAYGAMNSLSYLSATLFGGKGSSRVVREEPETLIQQDIGTKRIQENSNDLKNNVDDTVPNNVTTLYLLQILLYDPIILSLSIICSPIRWLTRFLLWIWSWTWPWPSTDEKSNNKADDSVSYNKAKDYQDVTSETLKLSRPPSSGRSSKYSPRSQIDTIHEEVTGFDGDADADAIADTIPDTVSDEYFKSPLTNTASSTLGTASFSSTNQKVSRRKKKFVFPKLLFNFNISNPPILPRKTLVLDLDETLIHSLSRYNSSAVNSSKGRAIEVKAMGSLPTLYHIYKRPFVEEFLAVVYEWFDLVCFTASIKEYADPVIDYLEEQLLSNDVMKKTLKRMNTGKSKFPPKVFQKRYYRNSCIFVEGKGYVKDLSVVLDSTRSHSRSRSSSLSRSRASSISSNVAPSSSKLDYSKIIIIDNSPISYVHHRDNGLMIEGWINDPEDTELMNLLPLLESLRFVSDVRCVLSLKDGQAVFNENG